MLPFAYGLIAAGIVFLAHQLPIQLTHLVFAPAILGCAWFFMQSRWGGKQSNPPDSGFAPFFAHIHSPVQEAWSLRWALRSALSFGLTACGMPVGLEGSSIECIQAAAIRIRPNFVRWSEQRRRTDASCALSASLAATFLAPFSAVIAPIELGIGGRVQDSIWSALTAFALVQWVKWIVPFSTPFGGFFDGIVWSNLLQARFLLLLVLLILCSQALSWGIVFYSRLGQRGLSGRARPVFAGIMMTAIVWIYPPSQLWLHKLLSGMIWTHTVGQSLQSEFMLFFALLLSFNLVLIGLGTLGVFSPLLALGGLLGSVLHTFLNSAHPSFFSASAWAGAAALTGAVLGTPLTSSILAYEMSGQFPVLILCLATGYGSRWVGRFLNRRWGSFGFRGLIEANLEFHGLRWLQGRSVSILDSVEVSEAMVTDYEAVHENEPITELHRRLLSTRYPFLPVVNQQGHYTGLLTVDIVQEAWQRIQRDASLAKVLEAKDLLYQAEFKVPSLKAGDKMVSAVSLFEKSPCLPVLSPERKVLGLLFVYHVRLVYDREVARQSLKS